MKLGLIERYQGRIHFVPHAYIGPVMWRCTNGRPNHATEWRLHLKFRENCIKHRWTIGAEFLEWQNSVWTERERDELGRQYSSTGLIFGFLRWEFDIHIARSRNTKVGTGEIAP